MNELIYKNSFLLMGNWVLLSLLAGLMVGLLLMIYRLIYPDSTAKLRYQTALISLAAMLVFTVLLAYLFPNISEIFIAESQVVNSEELLMDPSLLQGIANKETNRPINLSEVKETEFQYFTIGQAILGIFWLVGIIIYSLKFIGGLIYLKILLKNASSIIPPVWNIEITRMQKELNISKRVRLMISNKVNSPLTFGFISPVIVFPIGFFTTLPPEQIEAILLHELYHIKHRDYLINILVMLMEIIFFYHPLMWYLSKEIQDERENSCDDAVINQIKNPLNYAKALINVEEFRQSQSNLSLHFSSKRSQLNNRIMRLFSKNQSKSYSLKPFLGLLCLTFFLMSFTLLSWENSEMMASEHSIFEEKVRIKMEKNTDEFVLFIADNSIYTQAKNEKHTLWLDDVQLPLNSTYSVRYTNLKGMLELNEGAEYRIYSKEFLSRNNKIKLEAKNESDVVYRFHTNGGTHFTTEYNTWKEASKEEIIDIDVKDANNEKSDAYNYTIYGPVNLKFREDEIPTKPEMQKRLTLNKLKSKTPHSVARQIDKTHENPITTFNQDTTSLNFKATDQFDQLPDSLLIVLDGEILGLGASKLENLYPKIIQSIFVLKGDMAVEKYGEIAKNGALEITTKGNSPENDSVLLNDSAEQTENNTSVVLEGRKEEKPYLIFVDGVPTQPSYLKTLKPNAIQKIEVLKGEKAIEKYGKKAKNGVVEIYTKKGDE